MLLTPALKTWMQKNLSVAPSANDDAYVNMLKTAVDSGELTQKQILELQKLLDDADKSAGKVSAKDVFSSIRVKKPSERYSSTKSVGKHARTGQPVRDEKGRTVENPSELELAKTGALLKFVAHRSGVSNAALSEHETELLNELADGEWNDGEKSFTGGKSLLSDVTSGGISATPVVVDESLISFPLLSGELYPFVDVQDVSGRAVHSSSIGNPSVSWGSVEGSEMDLFDTTGLVSGVDTVIHSVQVSIEVGLDFLADSVGNVGQVLTQNIGQRLASELDKIVALGDGATQPQGVSVAPATIGVNSVNGGSGPLTVSDAERLVFALPKQYRNSAMRCGFVMNDQSYSRFRGVAVSPSDQRRVFGLDEQSYSLLQYPVRICNDLPNSVVMFAALARYRMYRRLGMTVRFETGGKELSRRNVGLLIVRARFGGRLIDGNACSKMTDAQS